jgi:hypothetical protein
MYLLKIRPFSVDCYFSKYIRGNIRPFSIDCHFSKYIRGNIQPFSVDCHFSKYIRRNIRPFSVDCHFSKYIRGNIRPFFNKLYVFIKNILLLNLVAVRLYALCPLLCSLKWQSTEKGRIFPLMYLLK